MSNQPASCQRAANQPSDTEERRKEVRSPVRGHVRLDAATLTEDIPVLGIRDLSSRGAGLLLPQALEPGTLLRATWVGGSHPAWTCLLRVRHCTLQPDDSLLVGCEFVVPLTARQLSLLVR